MAHNFSLFGQCHLPAITLLVRRTISLCLLPHQKEARIPQGFVRFTLNGTGKIFVPVALGGLAVPAHPLLGLTVLQLERINFVCSVFSLKKSRNNEAIARYWECDSH